MKAHAREIELPTIRDDRGALTFLDEWKQIPFEIKRIYYLYDIGTNSMRGGHAHLEMDQILIALSGSFLVRVHDGNKWSDFDMRYPHIGLHIPPMNWREIVKFSSGSVCLSIVSNNYSEEDYIRDFKLFCREN